MPLPIDGRKKPASVKVHVTTGEGVEVVWADGHASRYDFPYLRDHCPCATCNDERTQKEAGKSKIASGPPLPMFKPRVKAKSAAPVGNYAIGIEFTDGHASGIFTFDHLRTICPCEECAKEFRAGAPTST